MRSLWITATIVTAALAVNGCKHRKEEPVPGPRAGATSAPPSATATGSAPTTGPTAAAGQATASPPTAAGSPAAAPGRESRAGSREHGSGASGISWFQGTVEEAFSKTGAKGRVSFRF
jgi:hypothetical protein